MGFPGGSVVKNQPDKQETAAIIPGLERCPGEVNGNSLQHSCLEYYRGRGAWQAIVHGVAESDMTAHTYAQIIVIFPFLLSS